MKKLFSLFSLVFMAMVFYSFSSNSEDTTEANLNFLRDVLKEKKEISEVKVYYFHATRRCETCLAVENVTKKAVEEYYGDKVFFESINRETNNQLVNKHQISGQTLLIIKGDKVVNLTNDAFLNALSNPDKLKSKIKSTIDSMM